MLEKFDEKFTELQRTCKKKHCLNFTVDVPNKKKSQLIKINSRQDS